MRFVTFRHAGTARAGILDGDDAVVDLGHGSMRDRLSGLEPRVERFVEHGLDRVAAAIAGHGAAARLPLAGVELLAPLRPTRIFGAAFNYRTALAERGMPPPVEPVLFVKRPETVIGPGAPIVLPAGIGGVTYEAELAVLIGRECRDVGVADALSRVAGYAAFNDIGASEMIRRDGHFDRGKNLPTFGPFGPYLATADEIADPQALALGLTMDGESLQDGNTADMLFGVAELIAFLSRRTVLRPGDLIATGTPAGVAPVRRPPTWVRPGSTLSMWIEGLGTLTNPVVEGASYDG
ncbi:fumarylacetoacetate hydrolase family protein [Azospirillum halopraeferens]|uniref:fumarylacetoacetate hydrolase family protein n=1 Tax=Azospirillum halopraeferens TaxID=34010 RepID=UPI0003FFF04E|nr:fumarylacetoacetate hydrolase family protein [Azospirillum halopraeferens]